MFQTQIRNQIWVQNGERGGEGTNFIPLKNFVTLTSDRHYKRKEIEVFKKYYIRKSLLCTLKESIWFEYSSRIVRALSILGSGGGMEPTAGMSNLCFSDDGKYNFSKIRYTYKYEMVITELKLK